MKCFELKEFLQAKINTLRGKNTRKCNHTMAKYQVTRIVHVLQSTAVNAKSESEAIEASRKLPYKSWATVDRKRRKGYKAVKVEYKD